jgi:hypothetical protein
MSYYNGTRTHLSLNKDAPMSRAAETAGRFFVVRSWADCTINIFGFDLRQAQPNPKKQLLLAICRLIGQPIAIMPTKCDTVEEWVKRYGADGRAS